MNHQSHETPPASYSQKVTDLITESHIPGFKDLPPVDIQKEIDKLAVHINETKALLEDKQRQIQEALSERQDHSKIEVLFAEFRVKYQVLKDLEVSLAERLAFLSRE